MESKIIDITVEQKQEILQELIREKQLQFDEFEAAQLQKLKSSNSEDVTDDDRFERKREQMIDEIKMRAPVLDLLKKELDILKALQIAGIHKRVQLGSLVRTSKATYFISVSHPERLNHDHSWIAISEEAPVYQTMKGKKVGETFDWKEEPQLIEEVV